MLGAVAASAATGQVSAAEGETVAEATKWLGLSVIDWVGTGLTAIFGVGSLIFRDFRLVIAAIIMAGVTGALVYFGI